MAIPPQDYDQLISRTQYLNWLDHPPILSPSVIPPDKKPPCLLAGKVHSLRAISKATVRETLVSAWQFLKSLSMEVFGDSIFIFTFADESDMQRVQDLSPWNIRGHPLILKPWDTGMSLSELDFSEGIYWIQVHDLPLDLMTPQNAEIIGNHLGKFLCTETEGSTANQRKSFLRIKVLLPLSNPLITGFNQERSNRPPAWVHLKYERLSDFCFNCGRLGHAQIYCPATGYIPSPPLFGPNLRATPPPPYKVDHLILPGKSVPFASTNTSSHSAHFRSSASSSSIPPQRTRCKF